MPSELAFPDTTGYSDRQISQPLWLGILVTVALYLSFLRFYQPGDLTVFPHRFLANGFCQLIIATFLASALYGLFQYLGLIVENHQLRRHAEPSEAPPLHHWLRRCAGRPASDDDPWLGLLRRGLPAQPPGLREHLREMYSRHGEQRLAPIQFGIWVLPMLGFIGTVVGIIRAIGGLEAALDRSGGEAGLATVLGGLSFAFDTTLLGLLLVIPLMIVMLALRHRMQQHELRYQGLLLMAGNGQAPC